MEFLVIEPASAGWVMSRFRSQRGEISLAGEARASGPEEMTQAIASFAPPLGDDCRFMLLIPPGEVFQREIDLPIRDRRKLRELLSLELRGETALDGEELVFDAVPLAEGKFLAVWAREKGVAAAIASAAAAGAEPETVTAAMFSWSAIVPGGAGGTVAVSDGSGLALFRDGEPIFFRALPGGFGDIRATLAALEIGKGISVDKLWLFGAPGEIPEIPGVRTEPLPAGGRLAAACGGDATTARMIAGHYAAVSGFLSGAGVNFRSGGLAWTRDRDKFRKRLRLPAFLAALFVLLLFGHEAVRYFLAKRDLASLDASIGSIYREAFPGRKKSPDETAELRAEIRRLTTAGTGGNVLPTLKKLAEAKTDDITGLTEAEIDATRLRVKGDARSMQGVTDMKNRLAPLLGSVDVGEVKSRPDGSVSFTMTGTLKEGK